MRKFLNFIKTSLRETDKLLFSLCLIASVFGLLAVNSATKIKITDGSAVSRDFTAMLIAVAGGIILAALISYIDYEVIVKLWPAIAIFCVGIMVALYFIGTPPPERPDAKTWITLGNTGYYFQPSEIVKIGFIVTFGMHLDYIKESLGSLKTLLFLVLHAAVPIGLVTVSGDIGSALVFIIIFVGMVFTSGVELKFFVMGAAAFAALSPVLWKFIFTSIQRDRFLALFNPEKYPNVIYQQQRGLEAIGSGGLTGMGLYKGVLTQAGIVPESHNDMIFSVVGEETGFLGCAAVILLLGLIFYKIIRTGQKSRDNATSLMCYGMAAMLIGQVVINIGMCLMLLPVVGITLPFFSAGGSSNLCLYIGIGLVLSVHRFNQSREAVNFRLARIRTPFSDV
ncbi:MAG: FtsW/RodA/SpoVE family cell cycle protein [Oscillospiraceae bacterium]|nr:FtsW/RodA/SpoVE family cell cycle protein [Oscillospiraceae bacterium]